MRSIRAAATSAIAAGMLMLAACATPTDAASAPDSSAEAGVPAALQFTTTTLDGDAFEGTSLYGKATILWFWAPWCPSCSADSRYILAAIPDLPDGVEVIGVPTFSDVEGMHDFADRHGVDVLTNVVDADGAIALGFNLPELPSVAVIYADGYIATIPGALTTESVLEIAAKIAP